MSRKLDQVKVEEAFFSVEQASFLLVRIVKGLSNVKEASPSA